MTDWLEIGTWVGAAVGTLGIAGTIAACIAFPTVVVPILQSVVSTILKCRPCLIALVFVASVTAALFGGYWKGRSIEKAECRADAIAAELRNREIDLEVASKARSDETERANKIAADAGQRAVTDAEFIAKLGSRSACLLNDDDLHITPARKR